MHILPIHHATQLDKGLAHQIDESIDRGADVLLITFGYAKPRPGPKEVTDAVQRALERGLVVVCSAGNYQSDTPNFLGSVPGVIQVGCTDEHDEKHELSSYGDWVDVYAPAAEVDRQMLHLAMGGTLGSATIVAGITAMSLSSNSDLEGSDVERILMKTAVDISRLNSSTPSVRRRVDALAALRLSVTTSD